MKKSQLKSIIRECLDEIELDERGTGDPNSDAPHGSKIGNVKPPKQNAQKQVKATKQPYFKNGIERKIRTQ